MTNITAYLGADIFDGRCLHHNQTLLVSNGAFHGIVDAPPKSANQVKLSGGTIAPGFVDVQVNGGGGIMLNDDPGVASMRTIAKAHATRGTTVLLPTLITDTFDKTKMAINACLQAISENTTGIGGLHLEGPHLSIARKGAHDPRLIRPMDDNDLALLINAAKNLPALIVTIAPENVTEEQVIQLANAGATVSLGHTDADYETCQRYSKAGATMVTHLFNAMSQFQSRAPGVVGAALNNPDLAAGLIADGIHVHTESIRLAMQAKQGKDQIFLVTDSMAPAGTDMTSFTLEGRTIQIKNGRLTLEDGTLAGAYLDFEKAVKVMVNQVGIPPEQALAMATLLPAQKVGIAENHGTLNVGNRANFVHLDDRLTLQNTWLSGKPV